MGICGHQIDKYNKKSKNEIIIKLKIGENDINKDIYILNNVNFNNDELKKKYEGMKEINSSNTVMFINNKKFKFKKYHRFSEVGEYKIKLKFNIYLKDAHCMFFDCKNIIYINLSSFISKNITDMFSMFDGCNNLKKIIFF